MADVTVNITTPGDMTLEDCVIPSEYSAEQVIAELIDEFNLPRLSEDAQQITYTLLHENQNATIMPGKSLADAGVQSGDSIKLVSSHHVEIDPGEGSRLVEPPPEGGNGAGEPGVIEVVLRLLDLHRDERIPLQLDMRVEDLIRQIAANYDLDSRNELGEVITYRLTSKALGRFLRPSETLRQAGIPRLDRLSIDREEVAGASHE